MSRISQYLKESIGYGHMHCNMVGTLDRELADKYATGPERKELLTRHHRSSMEPGDV